MELRLLIASSNLDYPGEPNVITSERGRKENQCSSDWV